MITALVLMALTDLIDPFRLGKTRPRERIFQAVCVGGAVLGTKKLLKK